MYKRDIEPLLVELLESFRIVYLTGPRQSGKTIIAKRITDQLGMKYVTLDDQAVLATLNNDPRGYIRNAYNGRIQQIVAL